MYPWSLLVAEMNMEMCGIALSVSLFMFSVQCRKIMLRSPGEYRSQDDPKYFVGTLTKGRAIINILLRLKIKFLPLLTEPNDTP